MTSHRPDVCAWRSTSGSRGMLCGTSELWWWRKSGSEAHRLLDDRRHKADVQSARHSWWVVRLGRNGFELLFLLVSLVRFHVILLRVDVWHSTCYCVLIIIAFLTLGKYVPEGVQKLSEYKIGYRSSVRAVRGWGLETCHVIRERCSVAPALKLSTEQKSSWELLLLLLLLSKISFFKVAMLHCCCRTTL